MSIVFLRESPAFAPDEIADMARAVDNVCEVLEIPPQDAPTLKSIAERVIKHARRGERDPEALAEKVISEMRPADSTDDDGSSPDYSLTHDDSTPETVK